MAKNILSLTSKEAFDFLMKSEQYHGFELAEYFCFDTILQFVRDMIGDKVYEEYLSNQLPYELDNVNLEKYTSGVQAFYIAHVLLKMSVYANPIRS